MRTARLEGLGCSLTATLLFAVIGVLFLFAELQSSDTLLWTGRAVASIEKGGLDYYSFKGRSYTLDVPEEQVSEPAKPVTVYVDPSNPNLAIKDNPAARWFEASFVCLPFLAALATFLAGLARRRRFARPHGGPRRIA